MAYIRGRFNSIGVRLFILFFLCSLSLLGTLSALYYQRSAAQINAKVGEVSLKSISQASGHLDLLFKGYTSLSKSIAGNPDIQRLVTRVEPNRAIKAINERTIINALGAIYYSWDDVVGIHVISDAGAVYSYGSGTAQVIDVRYADRDWYSSIRGSDGEMVWLGIRPHSVIVTNEPKTVFAFGRRLYDLNQSKPVGVVIVEMEPRTVLGILSNLHITAHSEPYLLAQDGTIVAHNVPDRLGRTSPVPVPELTDSEPVKRVADGGDLVLAVRQTLSGWRLVSVIPKSDLTVELNETKQFFYLILGVLTALSAALAWFESRAISAPVRQVIREMKHVERGNFDVMVQVKSFDEINELASGFNQMVQRVNRLIERVRTVSASEKNAQLHVLQSQVNPHFLYNTLDMIYWMLDEKEHEHLGNVVLSLSRMFRYSSHWENAAQVTLADELEQIGHYVLIIKTRLDGRLSFQVDVDPQWRDLRLPKMTLQPIVENAIIHGLDNRDSERQGSIRVSTETADGRLLIHVEDNGAGMVVSRLQELQDSLMRISMREQSAERSAERTAGAAETAASLQEPGEDATRAQPNGGIGLENVHRRLVLRFGSECGLRIKSDVGQGTRVSIVLPLVPHETVSRRDP